MATATRIAPLTVVGKLNTDKERKRWIRYDVPEDSGLTTVYVDRDQVGLERDEKPPKSITITVKFGK